MRNTKPKRDVTGQQFGYLTAEYWEKGKGWHCKCKCGNHTIVDSRNLYNGHTTSCGCKRYESKNLHDLTGYENDYLIVIERVFDKSIQTKWKCKCKNCGKIFIIQGNHIKDCKSCGCIRSLNERKISEMLDEAGIEYKQQYTFEDLFFKDSSYPLKFDFAIFKNGELSHLIEFNGLQHYEQPKGSWGDSFAELQQRDALKLQYCNTHNIELRIIAYNQNYILEDLI